MSESYIGGYFGWERRQGAGLEWLTHAAKYQSARCAIAAFVGAVNPIRIWLPNYICGDVSDALNACGVQISRYSLSAAWTVPQDVRLQRNDWLLCVDYFGICREQIADVLARFGPNRVLVDAAQSLFYRAEVGESVVYSPRKFLGLPDGGMLLSHLTLPSAYNADERGSAQRCKHLQSRAHGCVMQGYQQFRQAEKSLESCVPKAMSRLTERHLATVDADFVSKQRIINYNFLAKSLMDRMLSVPPLPSGAVPLCCPVLNVPAASMRDALIEQGIFLPTYWPAIAIPDNDTVALGLRDETLYLPCDQRYTPAELARVVDAVSFQLEHRNSVNKAWTRSFGIL